ncbi:hypothetical protein [Corallococcus sp. AB038B]|uniref:hypothetical protein n=1 Tax=Corallococcus sp. AB038B TaxID=2316718 RepID=UPI0011C4ACFC|nr:hypothetical protein [Corallococcus sp. AB038B]
MAFDVFVYDARLRPLVLPSVYLWATDSSFATLDDGYSRSFPSGECGTKLTFAAGVIYSLHADAPGFGPVTLGEFNSTPGGRFDLVMNRLPPGGGPPRYAEPQSFAEIPPFIKKQWWSEEQQAAVTSLVQALSLVPEASDFMDRIERWKEELQERGIPPKLVRAQRFRTLGA